MGEPASVQCAQCKAPYAVFGVEPPLEYVCAACTGNAAPLRAICTHCGNVWEPKKPWHADELRSWPKAAVCGDCGYWTLVSTPKEKPSGEAEWEWCAICSQPCVDCKLTANGDWECRFHREGDDLGGPPVLSPLEERVADLERRLGAIEARSRLRR